MLKVSGNCPLLRRPHYPTHPYGLEQTFYVELRPISKKFVPVALALSGFTREQTLAFSEPKEVMWNFVSWVTEVGDGRLNFLSDKNGFDWKFINWYFHHFTGANPFGISSTNLGSHYMGPVRDTTKNFKHPRKTRHTHNPVDDRKRNAMAQLLILDEMGLKIRLS